VLLRLPCFPFFMPKRAPVVLTSFLYILSPRLAGFRPYSSIVSPDTFCAFAELLRIVQRLKFDSCSPSAPFTTGSFSSRLRFPFRLSSLNTALFLVAVFCREYPELSRRTNRACAFVNSSTVLSTADLIVLSSPHPALPCDLYLASSLASQYL